ncbi:MAG: ImmA/IrrE family metallo-endopeptidase [Polyangiaceae bacterium]|nr:ImmA/IrrE family metallo-endopeptidase [Polyangiaceae bacterium]
MSTTSKGDRFEAKVFSLLKREIADGRFFGHPDCCKLRWKQGYYSADRKANIIFDISIEVYLPGQSFYSLLILVECKDYGKPVPVDDAEEFSSKIEQVRGSKGIIVSTNSFANGTYEFCKSKKIGLARYFDKSTLKWELTRSPSSISCSTPNWVEIHSALTFEAYRSRYFDFYGFSGHIFTHSLCSFFQSLIRESVDDQSIFTPLETLTKIQGNLVEFVPKIKIEEVSREILATVGYSEGAVPFDKICEWQASETGLSVKTGAAPDFDGFAANILGRIKFEPLEITIFAGPDNPLVRQRFTLAHELGHHFLGHAKYMTGEYCEEKDFERSAPMDLGIEDVNRMEWQANYFASSLLLPREHFINDFFAIASDLNLVNRFAPLFVDHQRVNQNNFFVVTHRLMQKYDVSRAVVEIRLKNCGLMADMRTGPIKLSNLFSPAGSGRM